MVQLRLRTRGWIDAEGRATELGVEERDQVERLTDQLAAEPWKAIGEEGIGRLATLNGPIFTAALLSGLLPGTNTIGIANVPGPTW